MSWDHIQGLVLGAYFMWLFLGGAEYIHERSNRLGHAIGQWITRRFR